MKRDRKIKKCEKGFTLAELLIVVAIIAVLVAISIPIFSSQLEKSRRAVDLSNARNMESILAHSYTDGTIQFPGENGKNYVAAIVTKDGVYYRASGKVKINGRFYNNDNLSDANHDGNYQRVKDLFSSMSFDNMHVHAKSTENDGWASYCVLLSADGTCRVISSTSDIDLGDGVGGTFETALENLMNTNTQSNIEKAMNRA